MNDLETLNEANTAFYAAFQAMDLDAMVSLWAQQDEDVCIHPGWEIITGWKEIRESWRAIFANTGYMRFTPSDVQISVDGDSGRVTCIENIFSVIEGRTIHSRVACTNLFSRTTDGWRMVLHHGSPIATSYAVQDAEPDSN